MATWTIEQLDRNTADGGVTCAHWRVLEVDGDYSASSYGTVGFTPDPSSSDFIPYADLKASDVLGWVWEACKEGEETAEEFKARIESERTAKVQAQIDRKAAQASGVPW